eukprot:s2321_g15.t1
MIQSALLQVLRVQPCLMLSQALSIEFHKFHAILAQIPMRLHSHRYLTLGFDKLLQVQAQSMLFSNTSLVVPMGLMQNGAASAMLKLWLKKLLMAKTVNLQNTLLDSGTDAAVFLERRRTAGMTSSFPGVQTQGRSGKKDA